jgi:signal transduction histidine kinase
LARSFNAMACSLEDRQEDAARAEAKVRENERLAAMGATVAGITHEIANPLNGMYSAVQLLELELGEPGAKIEEEKRSVVGNLKNEIERLRSLLQDLRFLARPGQLKLKSVSVGEIAADILELESSNYKERGIRAEADFPASLPPVLGDREKLKQTLLNLCKNAAEAMPNGGQLRLRGFLKDSDLVVEVSDAGVGIPTDLNVFELFTTTKASGLGLGLAIVRQIVAAHGGAISYNSQPGRGTIFQVILPTKVSESTAERLGATIAGRT